jgi:hypothetical protein
MWVEARKWNIVKILGETPAKAKTSNSTSKLKAKTCLYANNAGAKSLNKMRIGKDGEL